MGGLIPVPSFKLTDPVARYIYSNIKLLKNKHLERAK